METSKIEGAERLDEILTALKELLPMPTEEMKDAFLDTLIGLLSG